MGTERIIWNGMDPEALIDAINLRGQQFKEDAFELVELTSIQAAIKVQEALDAPLAHTKTGRRRVLMGQGEFKGRHVTGDMIERVDSRISVQGDTITGRFGWQNPDTKILEQEFGTDFTINPRTGDHGAGIPEAHSLRTAFDEIIVDYEGHLESLVQGRGTK